MSGNADSPRCYDPFSGFRSDFDPSNSVTSLNSFGSFSGGDSLTEEDVLGLTVGEFRTIINQGISAVNQIDFSSLGFVLNDPQFAGILTGEARTIFEQAVATNGANLVSIFQDALAGVAGFPDSTLLSEVQGGFNDAPVTENLFDQIEAEINEGLDDLGWDFEESDDGLLFTSPQFGFDEATNQWSNLDSDATLGTGGEGRYGYLGTIGEVISDAFFKIIGSKPGLKGALGSVGGTALDFAEARDVGRTNGERLTDLLQRRFDEGASFGDLDAEIDSTVKEVIGNFVGLLPFAGPVLRDVFFGSRNSDPNFEIGSASSLVEGSTRGDRFIFGDSQDIFNGGRGADVLFGRGGNDFLRGGGGKDSLSGGRAKDDLSGDGGKDVLLGGRGKDTLDGGGGRDLLAGNKGRDFLEGGRGNDTFQFKKGDGKDTITDFRRDKIELVGADGLSDVDIKQRGDDTFIRFENVKIIVENTNADDFGAGDFIFS